MMLASLRMIQTAGATAFSPLSLSPALWLDFSDASTLYDATSGGSLVAVDGAIARAEDKSGNARHVTQSTSGNRPLRKTSIINGLGIARFDGSNDNLSIASLLGLASNPAITIALVLKTDTSKDLQRAMQIGGGTAGTGLGIATYNTISSQTSGSWGERFNNGNKIYNSASSTAFSIGVFTRASGSNYGAGSFYRNGSLQTATTNSNPSNTLSLSTALTTVGTGDALGTQEYFKGDIAEILVFPSSLGTSDRQAAEAYLTAKYAL